MKKRGRPAGSGRKTYDAQRLGPVYPKDIRKARGEARKLVALENARAVRAQKTAVRKALKIETMAAKKAMKKAESDAKKALKKAQKKKV